MSSLLPGIEGLAVENYLSSQAQTRLVFNISPSLHLLLQLPYLATSNQLKMVTTFNLTFDKYFVSDLLANVGYMDGSP